MKIRDHLTAANADVPERFKDRTEEALAFSMRDPIYSDDDEPNMDPDGVYTAQDLARDIDEVMSTEASNAVMLRKIGKLVRQALSE